MTEIRIGGHLGMDVIRDVGDQTGSWIIKRAKHDLGISAEWAGIDLYAHNIEALMNENTCLEAMDGSGFAPMPISIGRDYIEQEDVGDTETPTDMEAWRRNCIKMLASIRSRGLRHGDLVGSNIITRGNWPNAVDWQEGHLLTEPAPQKQPWSDSTLLMRHIAGTYGPHGELDTPRVARRWGAVLKALGADKDFTLPLKGKSFLDLGCFQGDFVALAAAEGMIATGIDQGGFRTGENSIEIGRELWAGFPFGEIRLVHANIILNSPKQWAAGWDIVMMFSTWPYIVQDFGWKQAGDLLRSIIAKNDVLFFETQLAGDGPGPELLKTDHDVREVLWRCGATQVNPIATIPVTGRPASRTVWEVRR